MIAQNPKQQETWATGDFSMIGTGVTLVINGNYAIDLNNNAIINLTAPTSGPTSGLIFFGSRTGTPTVQQTFSNNTIFNLTGAVYFPNQIINFENNGTTAPTGGCTQVVDLGSVTVDGVVCRKIGFLHLRGIEFYRYFDVATARLVRSETENGTVIREEGEMMVSGIRFPRTIITLPSATAKPDQEITVTFEKVIVNEMLPESRFAVPVFGRVFCRNAEAYAYILESLQHYPAQRGVHERLGALGAADARIVTFLGGVMSINTAVKPR